jgi:hypothetical protein
MGPKRKWRIRTSFDFPFTNSIIVANNSWLESLAAGYAGV